MKILLLSTVLLMAALVLSSTAHAAIIQTLEVRNHLTEHREDATVSWSVPLGLDDTIKDAQDVHLERNGEIIPAQFTVMSRWGGSPQDKSKSIMWLLVDTQLDLGSDETAQIRLVKNEAVIESPLKVVANNDERIVIETGAARYTLSKRQFRFFDEVVLSSGERFDEPGGIVYNNEVISNSARIRVEHQGPERISLWVHGVIEDGVEYTSRIHFYNNLSESKIDFRLENLHEPEFDGQPRGNDYGSVNSVSFDDLTLRFGGFAGNGGDSYTIPKGELGRKGEEQGLFSKIVLMQESSGLEHWDALVDRNYDSRLQAHAHKKESTIALDGQEKNGPNQLGGWLDAYGVTIAIDKMWQNYPKALRAENMILEIGLFPHEFEWDHQLRPGEFKTHSVWIRHHCLLDSQVGSRARSALSPIYLLAEPERYSQTMAAGLVGYNADKQFKTYELGTDFQLKPSPQWRNWENSDKTIFEALDSAQSYGWVDYGDIPTDFEKTEVPRRAGDREEETVLRAFAPFNLKYDALRGMIWQGLRHENSELGQQWLDLAQAGARHAADIDIHHSSVRGYRSERAWYQGGMYGHGYHNEDARLNPHRNYMNPSTSMSGPDAGIILWGLLSGDTLVGESGLELADNIYWKTTHSNYDSDGNGNNIGGARIARGVGLQHCEQCSGYEPFDIGRTGGNIFAAMIMAYTATGDEEYLSLMEDAAEYAERFEIEEKQGLQRCDRFHFQTLFIRNLGHYLWLREKMELGEDIYAKELLSRRIDFMLSRLWEDERRIVQTCYDGEEIVSGYFENNWQLGAADAFGIAGLVLNRPELIRDYGLASFKYGSENQFYEGSTLSYHFSKEFVNQVSLGQMFLYAWNYKEDEMDTRDNGRREDSAKRAGDLNDEERAAIPKTKIRAKVEQHNSSTNEPADDFLDILEDNYFDELFDEKEMTSDPRSGLDHSVNERTEDQETFLTVESEANSDSQEIYFPPAFVAQSDTESSDSKDDRTRSTRRTRSSSQEEMGVKQAAVQERSKALPADEIKQTIPSSFMQSLPVIQRMESWVPAIISLGGAAMLSIMFVFMMLRMQRRG